MTDDIKPLVYVAGPISADPMAAVRNSLPAFQFVITAGAVPFMPQWSVIAEIVEHVHYEIWLAYDFDILRHCDALLRLPGDSPGADREVAFCEDELKIPTFMLADEVDEMKFPIWVLKWKVERRASSPTR